MSRDEGSIEMSLKKPDATSDAHQVVEYFGEVIRCDWEKRAAKKKAAKKALPGVFRWERDRVTVSADAAAKALQVGLNAKIVGQMEGAPMVEKSTLLKAIGIDKATLRRRKNKNRDLDPAQAEAALRTMELTTLATETFGTLERASEWLEKPHPLLDGESPLEYSTNQYALEKVRSVLSALRYGGVV
jgi:putative toxin-antitoxin system antitoxin component (TIGR02293 family)